MSVLMKMVQNFAKPKYKSFRLMKCYRNIYSSQFLSVKVHKESENNYAYNILQNKGYAINYINNNFAPVIPEEQFMKVIDEDWSRKHPTALFVAFSELAVYCSKHDTCISNTVFDNFIDNLTDSLKFATDKELESIFYSLNNWPEIKSITTRNYIEVWVALDDECLKRSKNWSYDKQLSYVNLFYMLSVVRVSDFCITSLNRLSFKAKYLSSNQLVQTLFFIGINRKQPLYMKNLEKCIKDSFSLFTVDDLAIIAMGFFKSKTPISDTNLVLNIIDVIIKNSKYIHEIALAALLKLVRYSSKIIVNDRIYKLLDSLQEEVPRLSVMCNVHLALLGSTTLNFHKGSLNKIADNVSNHISQTRVKDLERLVLTYGTFNFIPETKDCFFTKVINELRKPERTSEIMEYGRSFACCVAYLSLLGIYPTDLINKVLSTEFLENTYGKHCYNYGREVLILHFTAEIYCHEGVSNHLNGISAKILAKKYTADVPNEEPNESYYNRERMILDIIELIKADRGSPDYVIRDYILPYHQRGDIIICEDEFGAPVKVKDLFPSADFGIIRRPPNDHVFTVLVSAGRNCLIHGTDLPTGPFISKIRDLEAVGYNAAVVPWSLYAKLETSEEKISFINNIIRNCKKRNNFK